MDDEGRINKWDGTKWFLISLIWLIDNRSWHSYFVSECVPNVTLVENFATFRMKSCWRFFAGQLWKIPEFGSRLVQGLLISAPYNSRRFWIYCRRLFPSTFCLLLIPIACRYRQLIRTEHWAKCPKGGISEVSIKVNGNRLFLRTNSPIPGFQFCAMDDLSRGAVVVRDLFRRIGSNVEKLEFEANYIGFCPIRFHPEVADQVRTA